MATEPELALVVACARNRVIGVANRLPWHLPGDLAHFKKVTLGKPVIMGRKTYASIGRPLPGRLNIVVSRNAEFSAEGVTICHSLEAAIALAEDHARNQQVAEVCLIGGAELYRQALAHAARIYMTEVDCEPEGDAHFPELKPSEWRVVNKQSYPTDDKNKIAFQTLELVKKRVSSGTIETSANKR